MRVRGRNGSAESTTRFGRTVRWATRRRRISVQPVTGKEWLERLSQNDTNMFEKFVTYSRLRWTQKWGAPHRHIKRLVIYLDNGPKNSGRRTQFLKRMVQFADWSGLTIRLVYYPPYHSKYNPIERCWSALERKWNGVLLNCLEVVLQCARRMTWKGRHPRVKHLPGEYPTGVRVAAKEMKLYNARLRRSTTLPNYDITIEPRAVKRQVK